VLEFATNDGMIVKVRTAKLEDALSLQRNCLSANTVDEVKSFLKKDIEEMEKGSKVRLVAEANDEVIGNLEIHLSRHPLTFHTADISTVVVNPRFKRKGIATKMIETALKIAKERKIEIVKIDVEAKNTPAVKLYLKAGFKEYGRLERGIIRKGEYDDLILLKKDLGCALKESVACHLVRPYLDKDFDDYADTLLRTWPCKDIREARENVATAVKRVKESGKEEIWAAEVKGRAVGFMLLGFTKVWGHKGEAFEEEAVGIDWFDVHPDFQRKGVGAELLRKAEERGRERGIQRLFMHTAVKNLAMINFASKNGLKFAEYLKEFWGKGTGDTFLLVKEL